MNYSNALEYGASVDLGAFTVVAAAMSNLRFVELPSGRQPFGLGLTSRLEVALFDEHGNRNYSNAVPIVLTGSYAAGSVPSPDFITPRDPAPCAGCVVFAGGEDEGEVWLRSEAPTFTDAGVANFSAIKIAARLSDVPPTTETLVQAVRVGLADMGSTDDGGFGTTETGPDQGGWGVPYGRPSIRSGELDPPVSIELKGVDVDGEVALIDSQNYLASGCAKATDNEYVQGDWADPPGVVANPIFRPKFWFKVVVHHTNILDGAVANFTIRPPPELTGPQIRQRNRNDWPQPSPLPADRYTLCFKRADGSAPRTGKFLPQHGRPFLIGPPVRADLDALMRVVELSPSRVFPQVLSNITITWSSRGLQPPVCTPLHHGRNCVAEGIEEPHLHQLAAFRDVDTIAAINCSGVTPMEVQPVQYDATTHSNYVVGGQSVQYEREDGSKKPRELVAFESGVTYQLCLGNVTEQGAFPTFEYDEYGNGHADFDLQNLTEVTATWEVNERDGVYKNRQVDLVASVPDWHGYAFSSEKARVRLEPPGLPVALELDGPTEGSKVVRGLPFAEATCGSTAVHP